MLYKHQNLSVAIPAFKNNSSDGGSVNWCHVKKVVQMLIIEILHPPL